MPGTTPLVPPRARSARTPGRAARTRGAAAWLAVLAGLVLPALALLAAPAGALAAKLLPLRPGELTVLLGQSGEWQPQSGSPLTLTLLAGPARSRRDLGLTAFVALQPTSKACAASPAADRGAAVDMGPIYSSATVVGPGNPLAPDGGAARDVHAASVGGIVVGVTGHSVKACTWLDSSATQRARATAQEIPLLNGLFAAAVWPTPAGGAVAGYALDAESVGNAFSYDLSAAFCGTNSTTHGGHFASGDEASYQVSISSIDCPTDGSDFSFSGPGGSSLGSISYTVSDAHSATIGHLGGCDLDGVGGLSLGSARHYVAAVGCHVARVLTAPYSSTVPRGGVTAAQVDGGIAPVAPSGTAVDLIVNG